MISGSRPGHRWFSPVVRAAVWWSICLAATPLYAADGMLGEGVDVRSLFRDAGVFGWIILALSIAMVALIAEHLISIRRSALMPYGLAEEVHALIAQGQFDKAMEACSDRPGFLSHVLAAALPEVELGYAAVEKAMEDASREQAARLYRKIEYLSVIGTLAPMLGLLGTVWGMIQAFSRFAEKANPQVAELAPGISKALVTTAMGLIVAVPALASFAFFRNRIDGLTAEASLLAEHVFADFKRSLAARRRAQRQRALGGATNEPRRPSVPPVAIERERSG